MLICVYDTETNGLPQYHEPSEGVNQPHIVQLAAKLIDADTRDVIDQINTLVKPDGWEWDETNEAFQVHGITVERAMDDGISEVEAVTEFFRIWGLGGDDVLRVGHNESFDRRIIRIATKRYPELAEFEGPWHSLPKILSFCTAYKSSKLVGIPPTAAMRASGRFYNKLPKLIEAYEYFVGKPMEDAHDAMVDVDACVEVYYGIQDAES